MKRPATTRLRCPECRGRTLVLSELVSVSTSWNIVDGALDVADGINEVGEITGYVATCYGCGRHWKPRASFRSLVAEQSAAMTPIERNP